MFTLRIILTGLIAYGPMAQEPHKNEEVWALLVRSQDHKPELLIGCNSMGKDCQPTTLFGPKVDDLEDGLDLQIWVGGKQLVKGNVEPDRLYVDEPFAQLADVAEVTSTEDDDLKPKMDALKHRVPDTPMALTLRQLIAGRFHMVAGKVDPQDKEKCDPGVKACFGSLSAVLVDPCRTWKFAANGHPERRRDMASRIIYEIQVTQGASVELKAFTHGTGKEFTVGFPIALAPPNDAKVVEVWIANHSPALSSKLEEFQDLYNLFQQVAIPRIPEDIVRTDDDDNKVCSGLPGIKPQFCPGIPF